MSRTKNIGVAFITLLVIVVSGCNKTEDPRKMVYNTWTIEQTELDGGEVGQEAESKTMTLEFTKKGVMRLVDGSVELNGTYTLNETATSMTTVMDGSTDTFVVSGLTTTMMTLIKGDEQMVLKVKE